MIACFKVNVFVASPLHELEKAGYVSLSENAERIVMNKAGQPDRTQLYRLAAHMTECHVTYWVCTRLTNSL